MMKFMVNTKNKADGMDLLNSLSDNSISCCFFDPQYRCILDKQKYGNEGKNRNIARCKLPQMNEPTIISFLREISRVLMPSHYCFLWVDHFQLCVGSSHKWTQDLPLEVVDMITWNKMKIGMGYRSRRKAEFLVVLQKLPIKAKATWSDHSIPDIWEEKVEKIHPHSKPIELQKRLILATTAPNELVLDPCAGGYSVLTACEQTNRNFIGCDIIFGE